MLYCTFSNRVEVLAEALKKALWGPGADPLEERLVILPSQAMKRWLMMNLVDDFSVATGLKFPYLDKAIKTLSLLRFPGKQELSFLIEAQVLRCLDHADLKPLLAEMHITAETLHQKGVRRALAEFCGVIADLFLAYGLYDEKLTDSWLKHSSLDWQGLIFKAIYNDPTFGYPYRALKDKKKVGGNIHIFCPSFVPKVWLKFFSQFDAKIYALSSTAHSSFADHPLLAYCGRSEKQFAIFLDDLEARQARVFQVPTALADADYLTEDVFTVDESITLLRHLQASILLQPDKKTEGPAVDDSIEIHSYPSKFAEVEGLYQRLAVLQVPLKEIVIMAPQISEYAPYIEAIFGHEGSGLPVQFFDTKGPADSVLVQGFLDLLALAESRFNKASIVKLLYNPALKADFTKRECDRLLDAMGECGLLWGIDEEDRTEWLKNHYGSSESFTPHDAGSWEDCFKRLFSHVLATDESLFWYEFPLFERWYKFYCSLRDDMRVLRGNTEKTLPEWTTFLEELAEKYFQGTLDLRPLGQGESLFTFASVYPRLEATLTAESEAYGDNNRIDAISACSLLPMRAVPAKVICLLGLSLESFPRRQVPSALDQRGEKSDYCPTRAEFDRMLFLETILSARDYLIMSYTRTASDMQPSLLLSELMEYLPLKPHMHKQKHLAFTAGPKRAIGMPAVSHPQDVTLALLVQAIRNPLKLFYEKTMGIYLKDEKPIMEAALSPYERAIFERKALRLPKDVLLKELALRGKIPPAPLGAIMEGQIEAIYETVDSALAFWGIRREDITAQQFVRGLERPFQEGKTLFVPAPLVAPGIILEGKIQTVCFKGLISFKEKSLAALAPELPLWKALSQDLLLFKEGERLPCPTVSWESLLAYYQLALRHPLPIFPSSLKQVLKGEDVLPEGNDPYLKFYRSSAIQPCFDEARPLLLQLYGGLLCL